MRRLAAFRAQIWTGPLPCLLGFGATAYLGLALTPFGGQVSAICGQIGPGEVLALPWAWGLGPLLADWAMMVVAMMTPLVSVQVAQIWWSSRKERAPVAVAAFLAAYWSSWVVAAMALVPLALAAGSVLGNALDLPASLAGALVYGASPWAGRARNLCHRAGPVPAFGPGILTDSARSGLRVGAACIGACWPWMLVPVTVQSAHVPAMLLVGLYLFAERIAPPAPAVWRVPPGVTTILGHYRPFGIRRATVPHF